MVSGVGGIHESAERFANENVMANYRRFDNQQEISMPIIEEGMNQQAPIFNRGLFSFLLVATFALKAFTDALYVARGIDSFLIDLKYFTALAAFFVALPLMLRNSTEVFGWQFKRLLVVVLCFSIYTLVAMLLRNYLSLAPIVSLVKLIIPIVLAYSALNSLSDDDIYRSMVAILIFSIIGYWLEISSDNLSIESILSANYFESTSATESSYSAGVAMMLCFYFCYYRKRYTWTIASILFSLLVFKRLMMLYTIAAFLVPLLINPNAKLGRGWSVFFKTFFFFAALVWMYLLMPDNVNTFARLFNDLPSHFTQGRSILLANALSRGLWLYGFGSIEAMLGRGLEMDFIRLIMELSPIGLLLFIHIYWDLSANTLYGSFVMTFVFFNMVFADSLSSNFGWTLLLLLLGSLDARVNIRGLMWSERDRSQRVVL